MRTSWTLLIYMYIGIHFWEVGMSKNSSSPVVSRRSPFWCRQWSERVLFIYLQKHFLSNILLYKISKCFPQISIFFFLLHFIFHAFEASLYHVLFQMAPWGQAPCQTKDGVKIETAGWPLSPPTTFLSPVQSWPALLPGWETTSLINPRLACSLVGAKDSNYSTHNIITNINLNCPHRQNTHCCKKKTELQNNNNSPFCTIARISPSKGGGEETKNFSSNSFSTKKNKLTQSMPNQTKVPRCFSKNKNQVGLSQWVESVSPKMPSAPVVVKRILLIFRFEQTPI